MRSFENFYDYKKSTRILLILDVESFVITPFSCLWYNFAPFSSSLCEFTNFGTHWLEFNQI